MAENKEIKEVQETKNMRFEDLGLNDKILKAINELGFEEPSKIQKEAIPVVLEGHDVIGQAQTGTGKTLAFGAPVLNKIGSPKGVIGSVIITPTRELAIQVNDEINRIGKYTGIKTLPVYGGKPIDRQIRAIKQGVDVLVGTPGRLLDLIRRKVVKLGNVSFVVLDEADEMLDMGFIEDIKEIVSNCPEDRQTMLFSATMPPAIKNLAKSYMKKDIKHISITKNTVTVSTVKQYYFEIKQNNRFESLCRVLDYDEPTSAIIFCKTKKGVDELVEKLQIRGYNVEGMHGDMTQDHRMNTLRKFKEKNLEFLVATDVAARGIDVESVTHVINYDLPQDSDSYVHRIGRTGRANREGTSYTFVTAREYKVLKQIERATKGKIVRKELPTVDDIFLSKYKSIVNRVKDTLNEDEYKRFIPLVTQLDEDYSLIDVASALMYMTYSKEISYEYTENSIQSNAGAGLTRVFINLGRKDKLNPKTLINFFKETARIQGNELGDIDILEKFSFFDISKEAADQIFKFSEGKRFCGRKVNLEIAKRK